MSAAINQTFLSTESDGYVLESFGPYRLGRFRSAHGFEFSVFELLGQNEAVQKDLERRAKASNREDGKGQLIVPWEELLNPQSILELTKRTAGKIRKLVVERQEHRAFVLKEDQREEMIRLD